MTATLEKWADQPVRILHIIAQPTQHDAAFIIGNRLALIELRDAIDKALTSEMPITAVAMCDDGEEYHVCVRCFPTGEMELQPTGYTNARASGANGIWPSWMHEIP